MQLGVSHAHAVDRVGEHAACRPTHEKVRQPAADVDVQDVLYDGVFRVSFEGLQQPVAVHVVEVS